jgi:hypothetical protein
MKTSLMSFILLAMMAPTPLALAQPPAPQGPPPGPAAAGGPQAQPSPLPGGPAPAPELGAPPRDQSAPPNPNSDRELREMVEMVKMVKMSKELGLSDEQTVVMVRKFRDLEKKLGDLNRERRQLMNDLRAGIKASAPDNELSAKLKALIEQDQKILKDKLEWFQEASKGYSVAQQAKLYAFMTEFHEQMRDLIQKAREMRGDRQLGPRLNEPRFRQGEGGGAWQGPPAGGGLGAGPRNPERPGPGAGAPSAPAQGK